MQGIEQVGFWLYSTLTQSMGALFALLGVFIVFRMQLLRERKASTIRHIVNIITEYQNRNDAIAWDRKKIDLHIKEELKRINSSSSPNTFEKDMQQRFEGYRNGMEEYDKYEKDIKQITKEAFQWIGVTLIISLIFLSFNLIIVTWGFWSLIVTFLVTTIFLIIASLKIWKCISFAMNFDNVEL